MSFGKVKERWMVLVLVVICGVIVAFFFRAELKRQIFSSQSLMRRPSSARTQGKVDEAYLVRIRELLDQKREALDAAYAKANGVATDEWREFGARLNVDIKREFIHLDRAMTEQGGELPQDLAAKKAALDQYTRDLLFLWREMHSEISHDANQLKVAEGQIAESQLRAVETLPSASSTTHKADETTP